MYSEGFPRQRLSSLEKLMEEYKKQQRRSALLLPPLDSQYPATCEPDLFDLETKFKAFFEETWGRWNNATFFPNDPLASDYLSSCVLLQWRVESRDENPDEPIKQYDKQPIIWYTTRNIQRKNSNGKNFQRKFGPSLQVCLLGLDPSLLASATFEAQVCLENCSTERHHLILMEKEGGPHRSGGPLVDLRLPFSSQPENKKRGGKVRHPWIECYQPDVRKHENQFNGQAMRGCKQEYVNESERMEHCVSANFYQLGMLKVVGTGKVLSKEIPSRICVHITLYFRTGEVINLKKMTNPFVISPGPEKEKDAKLFWQHAWTILSNCPNNMSLESYPVKWRDLREFFKVAFKVQQLEVRELDKEELLLIQCKLFLGLLKKEAVSATNEVLSQLRDQLLSDFMYNDRPIFWKDITDPERMISVVDLATPTRQSLWSSMTEAYSVITRKCSNDAILPKKRGAPPNPSDSSLEERRTELSKATKMIDLFNNRYVTMTSFLSATRLFAELSMGHSNGESSSTGSPRCVLLRFDDDNSKMCCTYYSTPQGSSHELIQNHSRFHEILSAKGGFWDFFNFPFSRTFEFILQRTPPSRPRLSDACFSSDSLLFPGGILAKPPAARTLRAGMADMHLPSPKDDVVRVDKRSLESYSFDMKLIFNRGAFKGVFGEPMTAPADVYVRGKLEVDARTGQRLSSTSSEKRDEKEGLRLQMSAWKAPATSAYPLCARSTVLSLSPADVHPHRWRPYFHPTILRQHLMLS